MAGRLRVVALVALVVLAGCSTSYAAHPFWTGDQDNPWRESTLTVAIETSPDDDRDYEPLVSEALAYWEENAERYAGYPIRYRIDPDAQDPDVVVAFVDRITDCGSEEHTAGCAPVLGSPLQVERPVRVRIRTGFSDASTTQVLKHELGHTLGLTHEDEPQSVMAAQSTLTTPPLPDATERALPWPSPNLSVHVDYGGVPEEDRPETERQVREALDYYDRGAEGRVPENVSFTPVDDPRRADVVVRFVESAPCADGSGSCGSVSGSDPDADGELEEYTRLRITLVGLDPDAVGWHVGYWLAYGFGLRGDDELPPPFVDADADDRRSEWWT